MSTVLETEGAKRELVRILWRQHVLSQPGGPEWLTEEGKKFKFRERALGPHLDEPEPLAGST